MGHDHHAHSHRTDATDRRSLLVAFCLVGGFAIVEIVFGMITNSLTLLSDAFHMVTDTLGLGMALAAQHAAARFDHDSDDSPHTFGLYRLEILAALFNAVLLGGVAIYVLVEAVRRLFDEAEVLTGPMLVVAIVGLLVNISAFLVLRRSADANLNMEGAYLEVLADTVGSVGVIIAALLVRFAGWSWADPAIAIAIGLWVLPRAFRLGQRACRVLMQSAPKHIDIAELGADLRGVDGVIDVHDLHVWSLTTTMESASAHLTVADDADMHPVLDRARDLMREVGIDHATLQVEPASHTGCEELRW